MVPGFTGRSAELQALTGLLDRPGAQAAVVISAIGGTAGVGKTALAVHWAHQVADRFPDGQLYVNLRGYDPGQPVPATEALAGFLRSLGVPGTDIPPEADERAARYRSLLAGKRVLIVADNAGSADQVRPLLPGTAGCTVLVTSRDALAGLAARDGAARLGLDALPDPDAVALLRALIGTRVDTEPGAAAMLAAQCCRLPLALRVAAELAVARPAAPLAGLAAELADLGTRLDLLAAGGDPRTQVRAVFSWSCRHLDPDHARLFRLLGLHPGPDFEAYAAAALTGASVQQARQALDALARAHLIAPAGPGRYGMHDLLRAYAAEQDAGLDTGLDGPVLALVPACPGAARGADPPVRPLPAYRRRGDGRPAARRTQRAGRASPARPPRSRRCPIRPPPGNGSMPNAPPWSRPPGTPPPTAGPATPSGWPPPSPATFAAAVTSRRPAPSSATHSTPPAAPVTSAAEAAMLNQLGMVDWQQSRYRQAADQQRQALALFRATGERAGEAYALGSMGLAETALCRYAQAVSHHREAVTIFRDVGDRFGEAWALGLLGKALREHGRAEEAAG